MLPLTLFFVVSYPNPVTAEKNYFSGLHLTQKCVYFDLCEISLLCFSQSICHCFRQDIILASESVLYADRIHEVVCIDQLWLKGTLSFIKQRLLIGVRTQGFISLNIFWLTQNLAFGRTYTSGNDPTHSFINETPGRFAKVNL
jgi:hypothetical protein